jgi:hypothetical protein
VGTRTPKDLSDNQFSSPLTEIPGKVDNLLGNPLLAGQKETRDFRALPGVPVHYRASDGL